MLHHCTDESCCLDPKTGQKSRGIAVGKVVMAFGMTVVRTLLGIPSPGKWTKLQAILHQIMPGILCYRIFPSIFAGAFKQMTIKLADLVGGDKEQMQADVRYIEEVQYSKVRGKRLQKSLKFLTDASCLFALVLLAIVMETLDCLTTCWLQQSGDRVDVCRYPLALDLASLQFSPITAALQYLTALLFGHGPRFKLILCLDCSASYESWCTKNRSGKVRQYRRHLHVIIASVHRRHHRPFSTGVLWQLLSIGDNRLSKAERIRRASAFVKIPLACLPQGTIAHFMRAQDFSVAILVSETWSCRYRNIAYMIDMQTADVERRHARNRAAANKDGLTRWRTMVSDYICKEATESVRTAEAAAKQLVVAHARADPEAGPADAKFLKGKGPLKIYYEEMLKRDQAMGNVARMKAGEISAEFWAGVRAEFEALPKEERDRLDRESNLTKVIAAGNRRKMAAAKCKVAATSHKKNDKRYEDLRVCVCVCVCACVCVCVCVCV